MSETIESTDQLAILKRAFVEMKTMRARLEMLEGTKTEPIAIIGMGCRFPGGANDPESYWQLLHEGHDAITEVPAERWDIDAFYDPDPDAPGKMYTRWGGFLKNVDQFDPVFFGISPREAVGMDPQQRLLLELCWEALESAGQAPDKLIGSQTGVFIGISANDYSQLDISHDPTRITALSGTGGTYCIASGRLSYLLGLQGPNFPVDTACSSSLVTVHLACQALRNGECNLALAGGVNLILSPSGMIFFSKMRAMAADGHCKTFDARADGYVRGEGCGIIVLKRLSDALAAGDNILALVRGSAVNHNGHSNGLTAPNGRAQEAVIRQALAAARVNPAQIDYVEAHGTGTSLGDPIEMRALSAVLSEGRTANTPFRVGSVKTNIGHLEAAAGIAGLIKTVLALQHNEIPLHLHLQERNPYILWDEIPVDIPTAPVPWPSQPGRQRYAGISSFGMGGTNAHVILEEAPAPAGSLAQPTRPYHLLALSAKSELALQDLIMRYASWLVTHPQSALPEVCWSAKSGRTVFPHRLAVVTTSLAHLQDQLTILSEGQQLVEASRGQASSRRPKVAFLFTGQGAQYAGMGQQLYESEPVFRKALERCAQELDPLLPLPLLSVLYGEHQSALDQTLYTQPALFALEYALAHLWQHWGVQPNVVLGHSVGEYVAACLAGVFSLADGLRLIAQRAQLMQNIEPAGSMLAVQGSAEVVEQVVEQVGGCLSVAAYNGPQDLVIAGTQEQVERARQQLEQQGVKTRRLQVSQAFHSPVLDPMLPAWERAVTSVAFQPGHLELISNVSGQVIRGQEMCKAEYWMKQVREPVQFARSLRTLQEQGVEVLIEMGPQPTLLGLGKKNWPEGQGVWVPTLRKGKSDWEQILHGLGQLYVQGIEVDWERVDAAYAGRKVALPTYPFQRQSYWVTPLSPTDQGTSPLPVASLETGGHPLLGKRLRTPLLKETIFEKKLSTSTVSFLMDHKVMGEIVVAGACYVSMVLSAAADIASTAQCELTHMTFPKRLVLSEQRVSTVQLVIIPTGTSHNDFQVISFDQDTTWMTHAAGSLTIKEEDTDGRVGKTVPLAAVQSRCQAEPLGISEVFYNGALTVGLELGPTFRWVEQIWRGDGEALCKLRLPQNGDYADAFRLPPGLLDSCFQVLCATLLNDGELYLPIGFDCLRFYTRTEKQLWCYVQPRAHDGSNLETLTGDIYICDETGSITAEIEGLHFKRAPREALLRTILGQREGWLYQVTWQPQSITSVQREIQPGKWLLLAPEHGEGRSLAEHIAQQLAEGGARAVLHSSQAIEPQLLEEFCTEDQWPCLGVLSLSNFSSTTALWEQVQQECALALTLTQTLARQSGHGTSLLPRLWFLTRGAHSLPIDETSHSLAQRVSQAPLWGFGRVAALEHPEIWGGLIDLSFAGSVEENARAVIAEIHTATAQLQHGHMKEEQVALHGDQRYVARLERASPRPRGEAQVVQANGTYLIIGGLGDLGMQVARWLAERGAQHLVLVSRQEPTATSEPLLQALRERGTQVLTLAADVAEEADVARVLSCMRQSGLPPLRGIVHAAGVLDDGVLLQQNALRFARVLAPKVAGAWHLHQQTQTEQLDWFVLFSSAVAVLGSPGQANYAAANAFLDALAQQRVAQGLPTLSINWGPWADVGMAATQSNRGGRMAQRGMASIPAAQGITILEQLLSELMAGATMAEIAVLPIHWKSFLQGVPAGAEPPLLADLIRQHRETEATDVRDSAQTVMTPQVIGVDLIAQVKSASPNEYYEIIQAYVQDQVNRILGFKEGNTVDVQKPLNEAGLDSLMALDLTKTLGAAIGQSLPATLLFDYPTVEGLATHLLSMIPLQEETTLLKEEVAATESLEAQILAGIVQLSDDEAEALLAQTLATIERDDK